MAELLGERKGAAESFEYYLQLLADVGIDFERFNIQDDEFDRWNRHRNDPWCVVGEHKHWPFGEDDDDEEEEDEVKVNGSSPLPELFGDLDDAVLLLLLPWDSWEAIPSLA